MYNHIPLKTKHLCNPKTFLLASFNHALSSTSHWYDFCHYQFIYSIMKNMYCCSYWNITEIPCWVSAKVFLVLLVGSMLGCDCTDYRAWASLMWKPETHNASKPKTLILTICHCMLKTQTLCHSQDTGTLKLWSKITFR